MENLISTLLFASFTSVVFLIGKRLASGAAQDDTITPSLIRAPVFGDLTRPLANTLPQSESQRAHFAKDLVAAGNHGRNAVEDYLAKRNLAVFVAILISVAVFALGLADGYEYIAAIACGTVCLVVYSIPRIVLSGKASRRTKEIERAIPDALDMIAMSITGGIPLSRSLHRVESQLREIYPALSSELRIVCSQTESGSVEQAFNSFADRINLPEVIAWCAMMRQSQKLGGELAGSLREYASRIRTDRQSRAERDGNIASLKLLLPVVLCLAPPIAVLLIGPAVIDFRDFINREKGQTQAAIEQIEDTRSK